MSSEKQSQKRAELKRIQVVLWQEYDALIIARASDDAITEKRAELQRQSLKVYLNED